VSGSDLSKTSAGPIDGSEWALTPGEYERTLGATLASRQRDVMARAVSIQGTRGALGDR